MDTSPLTHTEKRQILRAFEPEFVRTPSRHSCIILPIEGDDQKVYLYAHPRYPRNSLHPIQGVDARVSVAVEADPTGATCW